MSLRHIDARAFDQAILSKLSTAEELFLIEQISVVRVVNRVRLRSTTYRAMLVRLAAPAPPGYDTGHFNRLALGEYKMRQVMLVFLKTVRITFLILAIWQFLGLLPVITWLSQLPELLVAPGLGSSLVQVLLKLGIGVLSLILFYALIPLQRKLESQKEEPKMPDSAAIWHARVFNRKFLLVAFFIMLGVAGIAALLGIYPSKSASVSFAKKCTSGLDALQSRYPWRERQSAYDVAQEVVQDFPPEERNSFASQFSKMLQECRWTKFTHDSGTVYYIDRNSIRLFPGGRRVAAFLEDYDTPRKLGGTTDGKEYWSLAKIVLVSCQDMGNAVLYEGYMSLWLGLGAEVMRRGENVELEGYSLAPLWPSEAGSIGSLMVQAACETK